jgi:hypothetical protein
VAFLTSEAEEGYCSMNQVRNLAQSTLSLSICVRRSAHTLRLCSNGLIFIRYFSNCGSSGHSLIQLLQQLQSLGR